MNRFKSVCFLIICIILVVSCSKENDRTKLGDPPGANSNGNNSNGKNSDARDSVPATKQRISIAGQVFTSDNSHPAFGDAYRAPNGVIWSDVARTPNGEVDFMPYSLAQSYCVQHGGRLPTLLEYETLHVKLGFGSDEGYSPFAQDGTTEILPSLAVADEWSNSRWINHDPIVFLTLAGDYWDVGIPTDDIRLAVRCVPE